MDGADLGPLLRGDPVQWRTGLLVEARQLTPSYDAIRTADFAYTEHLTGETELYDLGLDPGQLESKHADPSYVSVVADLSSKLSSLRGCVGSGCWQ
jgi:hypothetical protein